MRAAPRVEACIDAVMKEFPGTSAAAQARYFEAVHQELAPLARELERENIALRAMLSPAAAKDSKRVPLEPTPAMLDVAVSFALCVSISREYNWSAYMADVYRRMIAAA
jgi:hypothetical protein